MGSGIAITSGVSWIGVPGGTICGLPWFSRRWFTTWPHALDAGVLVALQETWAASR